MTLPQWLFVVALTFVLLIVTTFGLVIAFAARRSGGGVPVSRAFIRRLQRSRDDRVEIDRWAFYAHRFTGFSIFAFLCLHMIDVSLFVLSRELYDEVHEVYGTPVMRLFESALLFAILFHTLNGLRLLAIDLGNLGIRASQAMLFGVLTLTATGGLAGGAIIMAPIFR